MEDLTTLGKVIKDRRLALNLRMDDVAKRANIARPTLWAIEKGDANCSIKSIINVLNVLNLSLEVKDDKKTDSSDRSRASRINTLLDKKINRFVIMCVEQYAEKENITSATAYKSMLDKGIIDELHNDYEDLHGMSREYLNDYIHSLLGGSL